MLFRFDWGVVLRALLVAGVLSVGGFALFDQYLKPQGLWVTGDLHVHSNVSADAHSSLADILGHAFFEFDLDYVGLSNHMRNNSRYSFAPYFKKDPAAGSLYYDALVGSELPEVNRLLRGRFSDKLIFSTFEWDMPTHEHFNIGILWDDSTRDNRLQAIKTFEYRFSKKNTIADFAQEDLERWQNAGVSRNNISHQDALVALAWLEEHFPDTSYAMLNHPRRYANSYTISHVRELNDIAPDVFFLMEGMVGNQLQAERGDYGHRSFDGVYGGADPMLAILGGWWDALLGEGRKIWTLANSDFHFKTRPPNASGYYPGEYARNYTWVTLKGDERLTSLSLLKGLRTGQSFSVFGDLINALEFTVRTPSKKVRMGGEAMVAAGQRVTIDIRFKQPAYNHREARVGDGIFHGINPGVHHIDLIAGDLYTRALPGTKAYAKERNNSTRVVKSFTKSDWALDDQGYYAMSYTFKAERGQYFRLRGTNLDYNVPGVIVNGEPQRSAVISSDQGYQHNYQESNARNYSDLWFYSNPIFVRID